jgi:hypothetical protein
MSGPLGWLRKEPSTAEVARQGKREVRKGQRDLQREIATLDREERQAITQAKALAKRGDQRGARVQAAHIARIRQQRDRLYQGKGTFRIWILAYSQFSRYLNSGMPKPH